MKTVTDHHDGLSRPPLVSIMAQGAFLIVSIHTALDDSQLLRLEDDLLEQVETRRARGIVIDVSVLDVVDSFATHTLSRIERAARLRGAETVVVGITPEVAMAMVRLSLQARLLHTALDLEEGLELLSQVSAPLEHQAHTSATP
jgi:rsbT antagonist protein RsbS